MHKNDAEFTGDESWCFAYNAKGKCHSATWVSTRSPKAKKLHFEKSHIKTMLVAFFNSRGLAHIEFVPTGQTVNTNFHKDVLDRLIKRINCGDWFLQHDNAPAHTAASVRHFLAKKMLQSFITLPIRRLWLRPIISYPEIKITIKRNSFWRYSNHPEKCDRCSEGYSGNRL